MSQPLDKQLLIAARKLIDTPNKWFGCTCPRDFDRNDQLCILYSVYRAIAKNPEFGQGVEWSNGGEQTLSNRLFGMSIGEVVSLNDSKFSHADALKFMDDAIARL